jgi:hypothetical protein
MRNFLESCNTVAPPTYGFTTPIVSMAAKISLVSRPISRISILHITVCSIKKAGNGHGTSTPQTHHHYVCNIEKWGMGLGTNEILKYFDIVLTILFWSPPNDCIIRAREKEAYRHHTQVLLNKLKQKA